MPTKRWIWRTKARDLSVNFLVLRFAELVDEDTTLVY